MRPHGGIQRLWKKKNSPPNTPTASFYLTVMNPGNINGCKTQWDQIKMKGGH